MRLVFISLFVFLVAACTRKDASVAAAPKAPAAATPEASAAGTSAPPAFATVSGTVEETLDAADYTYMRLKTANGEVWAAITKSPVKKGDRVTVVDAMPMDGFQSTSLNRKFDRIVFGALGEPGAARAAVAPIASGHEPAQVTQARDQMAAQHASAASGPADVGKIDVKKAGGPDGKTVAEIFAAKSALKGKEVAVRGKVVKYTPGVMGKNWIHLRDGSGSRGAKNDDLTITTSDTTALGDVILVRGTVGIDIDLGAGYAYPVLIENAKLSR